MFFKSTFLINSFKKIIRVSNSLDPDQIVHFVQSVCKDYLQMALVGKELMFHSTLDIKKARKIIAENRTISVDHSDLLVYKLVHYILVFTPSVSRNGSNICICTDLPEPWLLAYMKYGVG